MDEKESTVSGSLGGNSDTDSPPPITSHHLFHPPHHHQSTISMAPAPVNDGNNISSTAAGDFSVKKKRGRPRKYDSEGNLRVNPTSFHHPNNNSAPSPAAAPQSGFYLSHSPSSADHYHQQQRSFPSSKRGRGRSAGSGNCQLIASLGELFASTAGGDFTPHVVTVNTGEDVAAKIMSLSQKGSRGVCVLAANGAVSNVTIRQPSSSGGILTYEGRFEILSLTGSFTAAADHQNGGSRSRTGGLSVSLASSDGRVIGGGVAGLLLAASPIQMVVGSFMPNGYKVQKRKYNRDKHSQSSATTATAQSCFTTQEAKCEGGGIVSSLPPRTTTEAASGSLPGHQAHNNNNFNADVRQTIFQHPSINTHSHSHNHHDNGAWNGTTNSSTSIHRPSPDINISAPSTDDDVPPAVSGLF
ncbi:AT-hook motif nuclear-localized protein 1 [Linum perenne]